MGETQPIERRVFRHRRQHTRRTASDLFPPLVVLAAGEHERRIRLGLLAEDKCRRGGISNSGELRLRISDHFVFRPELVTRADENVLDKVVLQLFLLVCVSFFRFKQHDRLHVCRQRSAIGRFLITVPESYSGFWLAELTTPALSQWTVPSN